ncbi:MAG: acetoacetate decarboxylase family protein [Deltaproteobacteria bacterium]|nr:acetoacetate decarboxylase family protein [Deltaproteobacteria bacterium]
MSAPQINPGEISNWPLLKIRYRTDAEKIAALLPPGIDPGEEPNVSLNIYNVPVPDEPEMGVLIAVDADYRGTKGFYTIGLGIDQEAAIAISRDMNGQPKYPSEITYYRMGDKITARCTHQGYTYVEFEGTVTGVAADFPQYEENEWWVKVSRAVGGAEKAYDFPPHVVHVKSTYSTTYRENVEGELRLLDSPWDPIAKLLPINELLSAQLETAAWLGRDITLEGELNPEAFWPFIDTIGGSRWPGQSGGPIRKR